MDPHSLPGAVVYEERRMRLHGEIRRKFLEPFEDESPDQDCGEGVPGQAPPNQDEE